MLRSLTTTSRSDAPLTFVKMAGAGNDFVVIDNRAGIVGSGEELARKICTRRLSVGADGLILIEPSARATFRMRYFNSDGSAADFCANGTRCAARFAFMNVIAPRKMTIETGAGVIAAEITEQQHVVLSLPSPSAFRPIRPLQLSRGRRVDGSSILVGVPHYVLFLREKLWEQEIEAVGREIRTHPELAPEGANVNFVVVDDPHSIALRTYERGVEGETMACGSGVVASVAVSALFGRVQSPVSVLTRSGTRLEVTFERNGESLDGVRLAGDARVVFKSELSTETLTGFDPDWARKPTEQPVRS
jgi:diaminopimelate epimerase